MVAPTPAKSKQPSLSLEEYSTFQYMLARPAIASQVCDEITSFVFYKEPHNPHKKENEHTVLVKGSVHPWSYYICCLYVLPSHLLGMSEWISATATHKNGTNDDDTNNGDVVLRRFQYSYYKGLFKVDTRHMQVNCDNHQTPSSFRLVEYMEISFWAWVFLDVVSVIFLAVCVQLVQMSGYLLDISLPSMVVILFITQKCIDALVKHFFQ